MKSGTHVEIKQADIERATTQYGQVLKFKAPDTLYVEICCREKWFDERLRSRGIFLGLNTPWVLILFKPSYTLATDLDEVQKTGYFGTSRAAAAERLLAEAIRHVLTEGILQKREIAKPRNGSAEAIEIMNARLMAWHPALDDVRRADHSVLRDANDVLQPDISLSELARRLGQLERQA